jgi:hypothetical protein
MSQRLSSSLPTWRPIALQRRLRQARLPPTYIARMPQNSWKSPLLRPRPPTTRSCVSVCAFPNSEEKAQSNPFRETLVESRRARKRADRCPQPAIHEFRGMYQSGNIAVRPSDAATVHRCGAPQSVMSVTLALCGQGRSRQIGLIRGFDGGYTEGASARIRESYEKPIVKLV